MSDWTPGPWTVSEQGNGLALVEGPAEVHADRPYLRLADARLIAAAPEMAELLEKLWGWLANYYTEAPPEFQPDLERALRLLERLESHE